MTMFRSVVTAVMIAAVWGCFADLSSGQVGWFIGRLMFCAAVALACSYLFGRAPSKDPKATAGEVA